MKVSAKKFALVISSLLLLGSCGKSEADVGKDKSPEKMNDNPVVVSTFPANGAISVNPAITSVMVSFSVPMMDKSWSFVKESDDNFPHEIGTPSFDKSFKTITLPVKIKPSKKYTIWINSDKFKNFKSKTGKVLPPYKLVFTTGKPKK
ncbi:MAG: Ig-like domain-containing protein [Deltaproteobacteria bacterium]|nr:Ig-like domain-containing protein [Deltaproteobacteria bacterium]